MLAHLLDLAGVDDVAALLLQLALELVGHLLLDDHDGLVGAEDRVIERLRFDDVPRGSCDVCRGIHERRHVAGPDADRRIARAIGGAHHGATAGGDDDVGRGVRHQCLDQRNRGLFDNLDAAIGSTGADGGVRQHAHRVGADNLGAGMRAHDDRVARHQREHDLEVHGRDRVGDRRQREDHAGGAGQLEDLGVVIDPWANEVVVAVLVPEATRKHAVLEHFVLDDAHASLGDGLLGIALGVRLGGLGDGVHNAHDAVAVVAGEDLGGPVGALEHHRGAGGPRRVAAFEVDHAVTAWRDIAFHSA